MAILIMIYKQYEDSNIARFKFRTDADRTIEWGAFDYNKKTKEVYIDKDKTHAYFWDNDGLKFRLTKTLWKAHEKGDCFDDVLSYAC